MYNCDQINKHLHLRSQMFQHVYSKRMHVCMDRHTCARTDTRAHSLVLVPKIFTQWPLIPCLNSKWHLSFGICWMWLFRELDVYCMHFMLDSFLFSRFNEKKHQTLILTLPSSLDPVSAAELHRSFLTISNILPTSSELAFSHFLCPFRYSHYWHDVS